MNPMSHKRKDDLVYLCILMLLTVTATASTERDIDCLKSVKESLEDPHGYLTSSWNFNNNTPGFLCHFNGVECWNDDENRVLSLKLSNMGLKGQLPLGIGNCLSLGRMDLSYNELHGSIPLFQLPFLVTLDLSFNSFSGIIPSSIANSTYLNVVKLNDNYLTGRIPQQMGRLQRLKRFSVANNLLSGQIPNFVSPYFSKEAYEGNNGLCGGPLKKCTPIRTFAGGFAVGYAVSAFIVMVVYASYFMPWLKVDKNNKITVTAMILLVIRRKINKTQAHITPKISNFGDAMLTGSYCTNPVNNESVFEMDFMKEDVLSFGIVLLELITRIDASKMADLSDGSQDEWIKQLLSESSGCYDMIDISVIGQGFDAEIYEFLKLAFECVGSIPEQRPTMVQVYRRIKPIADKYNLVDDSELLLQPDTVTAALAVKTSEIELLDLANLNCD